MSNTSAVLKPEISSEKHAFSGARKKPLHGSRGSKVGRVKLSAEDLQSWRTDLHQDPEKNDRVTPPKRRDIHEIARDVSLYSEIFRREIEKGRSTTLLFNVITLFSRAFEDLTELPQDEQNKGNYLDAMHNCETQRALFSGGSEEVSRKTLHRLSEMFKQYAKAIEKVADRSSKQGNHGRVGQSNQRRNHRELNGLERFKIVQETVRKDAENIVAEREVLKREIQENEAAISESEKKIKPHKAETITMWVKDGYSAVPLAPQKPSLNFRERFFGRGEASYIKQMSAVSDSLFEQAFDREGRGLNLPVELLRDSKKKIDKLTASIENKIQWGMSQYDSSQRKGFSALAKIFEEDGDRYIRQGDGARFAQLCHDYVVSLVQHFSVD